MEPRQEAAAAVLAPAEREGGRALPTRARLAEARFALMQKKRGIEGILHDNMLLHKMALNLKERKVLLQLHLLLEMPPVHDEAQLE